MTQTAIDYANSTMDELIYKHGIYDLNVTPIRLLNVIASDKQLRHVKLKDISYSKFITRRGAGPASWKYLKELLIP